MSEWSHDFSILKAGDWIEVRPASSGRQEMQIKVEVLHFDMIAYSGKEKRLHEFDRSSPVKDCNIRVSGEDNRPYQIGLLGGSWYAHNPSGAVQVEFRRAA